MAEAPSRGYGITKTDMEASRLVFVSLKGAKPRRKFAVPITEGCTWGQFEDQVKAKLKIGSVGAITFAMSGERVTSLDMLQDIDEVLVDEAAVPSRLTPEILPVSTATTATSRQQSARDVERHRVAVADTTNGFVSSSARADVDTDRGESKYMKRTHALQRMLYKWFPNLFQPALPLTKQDAESGTTKRRRPRRHRGLKSLLSLVVFMLCVVMLGFLYFRLNSVPLNLEHSIPHNL